MLPSFCPTGTAGCFFNVPPKNSSEPVVFSAKRLAPGEQAHLELIQERKVYLTIHEFDPTVIEYTLNLIVGYEEKVPKDPCALPKLLELAKFCDYLDCVPAVKPFAKIWMEKTKVRVMGLLTPTREKNSWVSSLMPSAMSSYSDTPPLLPNRIWTEILKVRRY